MPPLTRFRDRRAPSGRWQAIAVLAPLLLLGALGLRGLQMSRQSALDDARRQAERILDQTTPSLRSAWEMIRLREIRELRLYPDPPTPAPPDPAQARYQEAIAAGDAKTLAQLEAQFPDALSPGGLPLVPLAEWTRLRVEPNRILLFDRANALVTAAVRTHPSVLTPRLLDAAFAFLKARDCLPEDPGRNIERWKDDESARVAWREHEREIAAAPASLWVTGRDGRQWWMQKGPPPRAGSLTLFHQVYVPRVLAAVLRPSLAESMAPAFTLDGVRLLSPTGGILAAREIDGLRVAIVLASPDRLYAQQRRQTLWLAALLALGLATAAAGLWAMRRALAREQRFGQLKSDFVSSVSHELRAPVASMRLMAENLESGAVPTKERRGEYHRLIAEECRRLSALIDNVLDFARIEQDRKMYDFAETDVAALVRDALDFMRPRAGRRRQEIRPELAVIDPPPVCDGLAVRQALINLLDNAIKFSPEGTRVDVFLRARDAGAWEIAVRDEGPGIDPAEHEVIFERFHRLGSELRRETQGAGIGLSIVRHIALAHGGRVELKSRPGEGSEFTLVLPLRPPGSCS